MYHLKLILEICVNPLFQIKSKKLLVRKKYINVSQANAQLQY